MDLLQAMKERHSVRSYDEKSIEAGTVEKLRSFIKECNKESGLHMQLVLDEPHAFEGFMAHYGKFSGVRNYIALISRKGNDLEEKCGYYGEKIVLYAQTLELNTCWVGLTYSKVKSAFQIDPGEKLCLVIAIGYGQTQGVSHNSNFPFLGRSPMVISTSRIQISPSWAVAPYLFLPLRPNFPFSGRSPMANTTSQIPKICNPGVF